MAKAAKSPLRLYPWTGLKIDAPLPEAREQDTPELRRTIRQHYSEALSRISAGKHSDMAGRFLDGGICLGILDPASNIIANTLLADATPSSVAGFGTDEAPLLDLVDESKRESMERRSLDALVVFLTYFFPYLADWEAVRYLLMAGADPIVAARLVFRDRGFDTGSAAAAASDALKLALRCAAIAAEHPRAPQLADEWSSLSHRLPEACSLLSEVRPGSSPGDILTRFRSLAEETSGARPPRILIPWEAAADCRRADFSRGPYEYSGSLWQVLVDKIHGFYLRALQKLPTDKLQSHYHRSLLTAGHCFGPFDPVSNIIVNTIWYEAAFPPPIPAPELDTLATMSLMRIEARSLFGLVSFLWTRYHNLSLRQALRCLIEQNLNLADLSIEAPCASVQQAWKAASISAWHPNPEAQAEFLSSCNRMLEPAALALLQDEGQLSSEDVSNLAMLLCATSPPVGMSLHQNPGGKLRPGLIMEGKKQQRALQRISRKVSAALSRIPNAESYKLHMICGANEFVSGPDFLRYSKKPVISRDMYHNIHVNFLVTQNIGAIASCPVLFFAELSNDDDYPQRLPLCCPVDFPTPCAVPVRCIYCEYQGIKIVHPATRRFEGCGVKFDMMVRGEDIYTDEYSHLKSQFYTNRRLVSHGRLTTEMVIGLDEDCMYVESEDFITEKKVEEEENSTEDEYSDS